MAIKTYFIMRMTKAEKERLSALAKATGESLSGWARRLLLADAVKREKAAK